MTPEETIEVMTTLTRLAGPAPEGESWDLTVAAWCDVLTDVPKAEMLRAVKSYVLGGPGRTPGTWWPKPGELLTLIRAAEMTTAAAWAVVAPILHRRIHPDEVAGLTPTQRAALASLPDAYSRARMSSEDIRRLRGRFLDACTAAEARATRGESATVTAFPGEVPRFADINPDLMRVQAAKFTRRVFERVEKPPAEQIEAIRRRSAT